MSSVLRAALRAVDRVADRTGSRWRSAGTVVLIHHRVGGRTDSPIDVPLDRFRAQLDLLAEHHRVVSLDDALAVPGPAQVVLTFDDGTADWADLVHPELYARGLPATFYVATDFVDRQVSWPAEGRPISWSALADMAADPMMTIGSHTHTHLVLAGASADVAADELVRSFELLGEHVGNSSRHFAYPKAVLASPAAEVQVRRLTTSAALAGNRTNTAGVDVHRLGRHAVTRADSIADVAALVAGGRRIEGQARERRDARLV